MKITTKGRYAIHILYDLAVNGTEHPVSVKEMATRQEISVKYTEQIISIPVSFGTYRSLSYKLHAKALFCLLLLWY